MGTPIDIFVVIGGSNIVGNPGVGNSGPTVPTGQCLQYYSGALSDCNDPVANANTGSAWPMFTLTYLNSSDRNVCIIPLGANASSQTAAADIGSGNWGTTGALYSNANTVISAALTALTGAGYTPNPINIIYLLGDIDARSTTYTSDGYESSLNTMISNFRGVYGSEMPFFIIKIGYQTNSTYEGFRFVRAAQESVVASDDHAFIIYRDIINFPALGLMIADQHHFTQEGYNRLGQELASAVLSAGVVAAVPPPVNPSIMVGNSDKVCWNAYDGIPLTANGDMSVCQINEGNSINFTGSSFYQEDNWKAFGTMAGDGVYVGHTQRVTDAPPGFNFSYKATTVTGATVNSTRGGGWFTFADGRDVAHLKWGTADARPISPKVWVKSSVAAQYSLSMKNSAANRSFVTLFTIDTANVWQLITLDNLPGDTSGTWLTTQGTIGLVCAINWALGSGKTTGTIDAWQSGSFDGVTGQSTSVATTNGATFQIGGFEIKVGEVCGPYSDESEYVKVGRCRRKYRKTFPNGTVAAQNAGLAGALQTISGTVQGGSIVWQFGEGMDKVPSIATYSPSNASSDWYNITQSNNAAVTVDPNGTIGRDGVFITSATTVGATDKLAIHLVANSLL